MDHHHMESEQTSNDDTNILSDLLNSAEVIQQSEVKTDPAAVAQGKVEQNPLNSTELAKDREDKPEGDILIPMQQNNEMLFNGAFTTTANIDVSKITQIRHVHIPYILNGELYQIQTQDGENVTVKCCHCPPDRVYRGSVRSTGNFHMHIKRRHPDLLEKLHDMKVNALLERRDRLMRNRKITHRSNRSRPLPTATSVAPPISSFKSEPKFSSPITPSGCQMSLNSTPDLGLMQTHNLKIKTVFQRHQMQQREAAEMRNWNNSNYIVMPIAKLPTNENTEEPINYSLKTQENNTDTSCSNEQPQQQEQQNNSHSCENFADFAKQPTTSSISTTAEHNEFIYPTIESNLSTTSSISVTCPSERSSYSSYHNYNMDQFNNNNVHNLSIIKPENLGMESESQVLDLSMKNDSGIFSNSSLDTDHDDDRINNKNSPNCLNNNRAGSQLTTAATATTAAAVIHDIGGAGGGGSSISNCSNIINNSNNIGTKWQELLLQVETSLRDIQREMNVRNHIESNRMFLDIAKFKFLHPGFQFNW